MRWKAVERGILVIGVGLALLQLRASYNEESEQRNTAWNLISRGPPYSMEDAITLNNLPDNARAASATALPSACTSIARTQFCKKNVRPTKSPKVA